MNHPFVNFCRAAAAALVVAFAALPATGQDTSAVIISRDIAQRHGLHRAWVTQVEIDRSRDRVQSVVYYIPDPPKRAPGKKAPADPSGFEILGKEKKEKEKPEGEEKVDAPKAKKAEGEKEEQPAEKEEKPADAKEEPKTPAGPAEKAPPPLEPLEDHGTLYAQSRRGVLQAIDAKSGGTIWVTQVGSREKSSEPPAVNEKYVAVVNGVDLYVLDRRDGGLVFRKVLNDVPTAGLAMGKEWVYVPMISGAVMAYKLPDVSLRAAPLEEKPSATVKGKDTAERDRKLREQQRVEYVAGRVESMRFSSFSPVILPPLVTRHKLAWTESRGRVYIAAQDRLQIDSRFDALLPITAPLTYWPQHVFAASRDGYVYALHEFRGTVTWRFSVGEPMNQPPVPMDDDVYAMAETGGMYCVNMRNGDLRWSVPQIRSFLAASATRLYVADVTGALQVLDRKSGARLDSLRIDRMDVRVLNLRSDRVFLGTTTGVLQCLHEIQQSDPLIHVLPPDTFELAKSKEAAKTEKKVEEMQPEEKKAGE